MNAPLITARVAGLIRNPNSAMPSELGHSAQKKQTEPAKTQTTNAAPPKTVQVADSPVVSSEEYSLALSPLALKILDEAASHESEWEQSRSENIMRIQQLVQDRQYTLTPEVVDGIAHKIVAMLP